MSNLFHPYRRVTPGIFGYLDDQLPAHNGNVRTVGVVICGFCQSTAVYINGLSPVRKPCCPLIHLPHKFLLAASNMLCHCYTGVISRGDHNALDHSLHVLGFSFLQKYLGATHRFRIGTVVTRSSIFSVPFSNASKIRINVIIFVILAGLRLVSESFS